MFLLLFHNFIFCSSSSTPLYLLPLSFQILPGKSKSRKEEKKQMCPLRLILIFLSATLAGFFVLKKLNSTSDDPLDDSLTDADPTDDSDSSFSKVGMVMKSGFWTCVDMASGRYLWNHICSDSKLS